MTVVNQTTSWKLIPVPRCPLQLVLLCLLQISHGLTRDRAQAFAVRGWRLRNKLQFLPHN